MTPSARIKRDLILDLYTGPGCSSLFRSLYLGCNTDYKCLQMDIEFDLTG